jgi:UDP-glucose 4-epimerase
MSMNVLVTGGAGFIGRWVTYRLLSDGHRVWALDDLSNGRQQNLDEFRADPLFRGFVVGDIKDRDCLRELFKNEFELCFHLAASINVQDSIDDPDTTFRNDVVGTFNVLEECRKHMTKIVFMSTCMVYDKCSEPTGIDEEHPTVPASPYAGSKLAGENLVLSYYRAYGLPAVVIRPFNTYGPFQKTSGEGGVIAVFIKRSLDGKPLYIYGSGTQTRDFLYVKDCAEFVAQAGYQDAANGQVINAGTGCDISVNQLAGIISAGRSPIEHVPHIHPQSEIQKLLCRYEKATSLLGWRPRYTLEQGLAETERWISSNQELT